MNCNLCIHWIGKPDLGTISEHDYDGPLWGKCMILENTTNICGDILSNNSSRRNVVGDCPHFRPLPCAEQGSLFDCEVTE